MRLPSRHLSPSATPRGDASALENASPNCTPLHASISRNDLYPIDDLSLRLLKQIQLQKPSFPYELAGLYRLGQSSSSGKTDRKGNPPVGETDS